jgi:hypothetical protein
MASTMAEMKDVSMVDPMVEMSVELTVELRVELLVENSETQKDCLRV